jgi:hypothetical protein
LTIDIDSTICPVYGRAEQGAGFGYTKVCGYHPQLATCAQTGQVLFHRLRGGSAGAACGAASFLTETVSRVRHAGATGQLTVRADSAFLQPGRAAHRQKVRRAVLRHRPAQPPHTSRDRGDRRGRLASDPVLAQQPRGLRRRRRETAYTCFAGTKRALTVRLVVRRVRPTPSSQLAPNGVGKTTTVECMEGLRRPDGGSVAVLGLDPRADAAALRPQVGVQLQQQLPDGAHAVPSSVSAAWRPRSHHASDRTPARPHSRAMVANNGHHASSSQATFPGPRTSQAV